MTLGKHLLAAAIAAPLVFHFAGPAATAVFAAASVLIDVDHYLVFIKRTGSFSPGAMFRWYDRIEQQLPKVRGFYFGACPFHTVEFFTAAALLALFHPLLLALFCGFLFHQACDTVSMYHKGRLGVRAWSLFYDFYTARKPHLGDAVENWEVAGGA